MAQGPNAGGSIYSERLASALDAADRNRLILLATVGYGLCRIASGSPEELAGLASGRTIADIGKLCGIVCMVAAAYSHGGRRGGASLALAPSLLALAATLLAAASPFLPQDAFLPLATASLFLGNFGSAALMLQWLELIACAPMRQIALAITGAELINTLFTLAMGSGSHLHAAATALAVGSSTALFVFCLRGCEVSPVLSVSNAHRTSASPGMFVSFRLMLWVAFYCMAYGFVTSYSGLDLVSPANGVGGILPALLILSAAAFAPKWFDLRLLKYIALALMVSGLLLVALFGADSTAMQVLAGSGAACCRLCGYSLACMQARRRKVSSLAGCAAVKALIVVGTLAGLQVGDAALPEDGTLLLLVLAIAACLLSAFLSPFNIDEEGLIEQTVGSGRTLSRREALDKAAASAGLSPRESTVFSLMASGMDTAQISEELFISKSAVRAHQSRIYAKFGVHSQEEFDVTVAKSV